MKTGGTDGTIVGRQCDRVGARARERERGGDVEDSHLRAGRVAPTSSHKRRLADQAQFRAPRII